ncbi:TetR/AcrR family transcriptional regulator [Kibdelosporangium persicum]|uniref:HTH-type transcriptional regulator MtrR n=1 Tax=Kibdelosporangium persicum TaxID=2698649 RepID=A0ABX2FDU8_9PSEU|nr:TetR/AcrR family transcriptional regulator [Kibdelosporangium persicum]NRN69549.1 HTH-type transcriptional regulator MtrR [Kibdelosporangium persicum]
MSPADPQSTSDRRERIVGSATEVFLRFGFRKTSMDDVAQAAGISRQGLYLHFKNKAELFEAMMEHMLAGMWAGCRQMFDRDDLDVSDRLIGALDAFHGLTVGRVELGRFSELLDTARSFAGPRLRDMEREFVEELAGLLDRTGVAARWTSTGLTPFDLAEHLFAASAGAKYEAQTHDAYLASVRIAATVVTNGPDRPPTSPSRRRAGRA